MKYLTAIAVFVVLVAQRAAANELIIRDYYHEMSCLNPGTVESVESVGRRLLRDFPAIDQLNLLVMQPLEEQDEWRHFKQAIDDLTKQGMEVGGIFILTCRPYRDSPRKDGFIWEPYMSNRMGLEILSPASEF